MIPDQADAKSVKNFHQKDDLDASPNAHHHTLGWGARQAAPGGLTNSRLATVEASGLKVGDFFFRWTYADEDEYFKECNGQTLDASYTEFFEKFATYDLPDYSAVLLFPDVVHFMMRVK